MLLCPSCRRTMLPGRQRTGSSTHPLSQLQGATSTCSPLLAPLVHPELRRAKRPQRSVLMGI